MWEERPHPSGSGAPTRLVPLPLGFKPNRDRAWLAKATGIDVYGLNSTLADNWWGDGSDGMAKQIALPGFRGHFVVMVRDGSGSAIETWEQIAAQNGVPAAELKQIDEHPDPADDTPDPFDWLLVHDR